MKKRLLFVFLFCTIFGYGQANLSLAMVAGVPGVPFLVPMTMSGATILPAAYQFTITFDPTKIASITAINGPAPIAAGKSSSCANSASSLTCIVWGLNSNLINNGVVNYVSIVLASGVTSTNLFIGNTLGATPEGDALSINGIGSIIYSGDTTCDVNGDSAVNILDVQQANRMAIGLQPCTIKINSNLCNVVTSRRIINAVLGDSCVVGQ